MSEKSFSPISRNEAERKIIRAQRDFSAGMFNDIPASTIPENGVAYLKNFKNKGTELVGRSGSRRWGNYNTSTPSASLPTIATDIMYSDSVVGEIRTITITNGYSFSTDNIGDFFIRTNGINERIINVTATDTIITETEDITEHTSQFGSLRRQVNGIYYHNVQKKIIIHIGTEIYVANDLYVSGWSKAYCESYDNPINEISIFDEKDNDVYIFNRNGIYKLNLNIIVGNDYFFYKINSNIPSSKLVPIADVSMGTYGRRYIYGLTKFGECGQNDNRQSSNIHLLLDSGTNAIIDNVDYAENRFSNPISDIQTSRLTELSVPVVNGSKKETHWDSYSIWGTVDTGDNGIDPVTGNANNPEQYIWIDDIPIMKCFMINNTDSTITCIDGNILDVDFESDIKIFNGLTFDDTYINVIDSDNNTFETTIDYTGISLYNSFAFIGAEKGAKFSWNSTDRILTVTNGYAFISSDVGKRIFLSNGSKIYIKRYINASNVEIAGNVVIPSIIAGCWNPTSRSYVDSTSDDTLRARLNSYSCYQRFYQPLPVTNTGVITTGFVITSLRDNNYIYYSQIPDGYEYLAGYYHPTYQFTLVKDKIRSLKVLNDKLIVYCFNSTSTIDVRSFSEFTLDDIGVSIATLPNQTVIDDTIGVIAYGSIQSLENGNHIMITNEPAIRIFDGNSYVLNASTKKITEILKRLQPNMSSVYSPLTGYTFWGLDE